MKMRTARIIFFLATLTAIPLASFASVGVGARFGTTGMGGEVAVELVDDYLNLRLAGNGGSLNINVDQDDVTYETEVNLLTWLAVLDWHVGGGPFKIVIGGCYNGTDASGTANPVNPIDVGGTTYTPAQIGKLFATAEYDSFGGYLGIGFGNIASSKNGHWSASMDLGVMFFQEPDLTLKSRGGTLSNTRGMQESLQQELDDFNEDYLTWLRYYPVLTLGIAVRF